MTRDHSSGAAIELDPDGGFRDNPAYVSATFDDQVVRYHLGTHQAPPLNQSAGIILDLIGSRCSTAEIHDLLRRAYPESANLGRDVDRTLRYLLRHGAVRPDTRTGC